MQEFAFVLAGLFVGTVVGLTGVGGGSLMTPILIFFFGMKPHLAIGTDLLFAAGTKLSGSVKLARSRTIDWPVVLLMALGSVPASLLTLVALDHFGATSPAVQKAMTTTLGVALLLTAVATLYKALFGQKQGTIAVGQDPALAARPIHKALPVLFGAVIGVLVTLTSVGAGAIGVLVLMLVYPALPLQRIVAADIAHAVPLTLVAGLGHAGLGTVDWWLLAKLLAGSIPGIWLGSHLNTKLPERFIRSVLSLLLAYAGTKLIAI
ncbi:sulfite exporter TauE/SafE family protein [Curvibacter sp. RS43]|uniref:sulfite exporter TauE/SafE family protein n=1 Tax=Curvibacter microcysteis TaxID=3026419 RepID=UPI00235F3FD4|nr:sulfite exporter TauE/SafE family protein [Curvibacter sp. RS43]MDD0809422.1 sulfite exporter TauE/SafE family protein [Curvibacter sp. RS43]